MNFKDMKSNLAKFVYVFGQALGLILFGSSFAFFNKGSAMGFILLVSGGVILLITYFVAAGIESRYEATTKSNLKTNSSTTKVVSAEAAPKKPKEVPLILPAENNNVKLDKVCQGDIITLNIFGQMRGIEIYSQTIAYDESLNENDKNPLSQEEVDLINWLISSNVINTPEMQKLLLDCVQDSYMEVLDEEEALEHKSILPPEIEINCICIPMYENNNPTTIAFCGECGYDTEHGIAIIFDDKQFDGIGQYMDYEQAGSSYLYRGRESEE